MKQVIFITGISSGFGKEIAKQLSEKGHKVYGSIRKDCEVPDDVNTVFMELTDPDSIKKAVGTVIEAEGCIDVLINNAGMHTGGPIEEVPFEVLEQQVNTNFYGWLHVIRAVLPCMRVRRKGTIINISSIGALMGLPFQGVYSSVKFAMEGMSDSLRHELRPFGIKLVMINPGDFKTRNTDTRVVSIEDQSAYKEQFEKTRKVFEKDERGGEDPAKLAKKICRIVERKHPRQRYLVGAPFQKSAVLVKKILPEAWFNYLIARYYHVD